MEILLYRGRKGEGNLYLLCGLLVSIDTYTEKLLKSIKKEYLHIGIRKEITVILHSEMHENFN